MADRTFLTWPFFDAAHRRLADELGRWAAREIALQADVHGDVDGRTRALVRALGDAGWLGHCVPTNRGQPGRIDARSLSLAREILAYHSGLADFAFAMQGLGSAPIGLFGSADLRDRYLPGIARGERIGAFAISEPDCGSDVANLTTAARRAGDDFRLDGTKTWISNAGLADQYVLFARTGEAPGARGLSAFVVDAETPGLAVSARIDVIAPHPLGTLTLADCRVPATNMLGQPGDGFKVAMATLDLFRTSVGAAALGFARRALDEAIARARSRTVFGQRLSDMQLIQAKLADMALKIDAAALLIYRAAWTKDTEDRRVTREASMAKLYATEAAQAVVDEAVQIFGALGVVSGTPVEQLYREVRALRIYEGTSEIQRLVIAAQTLAAEASS